LSPLWAKPRRSKPTGLKPLRAEPLLKRRGGRGRAGVKRTYDTVRPHQALDYLTPFKFLEQWKEN